MPSAARLYSVEDVRALPDDGNRYETIAGELFVTPAPSRRHQTVLAELTYVLTSYVKRHRLGHVWFAPLDVVFGPRTLVDPDLLFLHSDRSSLATEQEIVGPPDLVVEVLSTSTARIDRGRKRALYREEGVREYWVVDPERQQIEVWRPGEAAAEVHTESMRWLPDPTVEPLTVRLVEIFGPHLPLVGR